MIKNNTKSVTMTAGSYINEVQAARFTANIASTGKISPSCVPVNEELYWDNIEEIMDDYTRFQIDARKEAKSIVSE